MIRHDATPQLHHRHRFQITDSTFASRLPISLRSNMSSACGNRPLSN
jgi:hypothetical protein